MSSNQKKPRLSTKEAAEFIGCSPTTLIISRVQGRETLFGKPAPAYRKIGRKVVYDLVVLEEWLEQFEPQNKTHPEIK